MKEDQHTEWKESWRDDCLKWISGFANAEGGVLVLGRNDRGVAVGVRDARKLLEDVPNKVRDVLGILVDVSLKEEGGVELVEVAVEPYPVPVSYKGEYHYRSGSTKQELKGAALDRFLLRKQGRHWDGVPVPHVTADDLDERAIARFKRLAQRAGRLSPEILDEPTPALLDKLHLIDGSYLKRAAVLLFHPDAERWVTGAYVKIGFFESNVDLRYQDEVHGDLMAQVGGTIEVLRAKYLKGWISYEGLQRVETYPVPDAALREAILNAVIHKDYASGTPIQISVYSDRLMIWSPGQLPPTWTVERLLRKHASQPFNPDVANAFFRAGMIEAWGRGIERMRAACSSAGSPDLEIRDEGTGLWVVFPYGPAPEAPGQDALKGTTQETTQETAPPTQETTQETILALLRAEPTLTRDELAARTGITADGVKYHLKRLTAAGAIRRVGSTRAGRWEVLT